MTQKKISLMDFEGNPNIGIYIFVNDKFCLLGPQVPKSRKEEIQNTLGVPVYNVTVLATELLGIFIAGNNDFILVPDMYDYEKNELEKICKEHEVKLITLDDVQNTYGNNLCVGNKKILINPNYPDEFLKKLRKDTKYEVIPVLHSEHKAIGSTMKFVCGKYFLSQEYEEKHVKQILKEIGGIGTINKGSNYISSGFVGNSNGAIIGSSSSTVEIQAIIESLDYI